MSFTISNDTSIQNRRDCIKNEHVNSDFKFNNHVVLGSCYESQSVHSLYCRLKKPLLVSGSVLNPCVSSLYQDYERQLFTSLDGEHPVFVREDGTLDAQEGSPDGKHQVISKSVESVGQTWCLT